MIQLIGMMVGAYIMLRCLEILARPSSMFSSDRNKRIVFVFAVLVFVAELGLTFTLIRSGESIGDALAPFRR